VNNSTLRAGIALGLLAVIACEPSPSGKTIHVAPSSSTSALRVALGQALPGDVVVMDDGPAEVDFPTIQYVGNFNGNPSNGDMQSGSNWVHIRTAPGAIVSGFKLTEGSRFIRFDRAKVRALAGQSGFSITKGANYISLDHVDVNGGYRSVTISPDGGAKPSNVFIVSSSLHGSSSDALTSFGASSLFIQGNDIRPHPVLGSTDHVDGVYVGGSSNVYVDNNVISATILAPNPAACSGTSSPYYFNGKCYGGPHQGVIVGPTPPDTSWGNVTIQNNHLVDWVGTGIIVTDKSGNAGSNPGYFAVYHDITIQNNEVKCANGGVTVFNNGSPSAVVSGNTFIPFNSSECV
jgi:hypothetical protein